MQLQKGNVPWDTLALTLKCLDVMSYRAQQIEKYSYKKSLMICRAGMCIEKSPGPGPSKQ